MKLRCLFASLAIAAMGLVPQSHAAFIIETTTGGKALANFGFGGDTTSRSTTTSTGTAFGLTPGIGSSYSGDGTVVDTYTFSYTPGTDADNTAITVGQDLGNGNFSTGEVGGASGLYNVYATWPTSDNINAATSPTHYSISGDSLTATLSVNQNQAVTGLGNGWVLIGQVDLTAGNTYVLTQESSGVAFVSMRSSGAMFEYAGNVIPEPASLALVGLIGLATAGMRIRR